MEQYAFYFENIFINFNGPQFILFPIEGTNVSLFGNPHTPPRTTISQYSTKCYQEYRTAIVENVRVYECSFGAATEKTSLGTWFLVFAGLLLGNNNRHLSVAKGRPTCFS